MRGTFDVGYQVGDDDAIAGYITHTKWEGDQMQPYAVLNIGNLTLFSPTGGDPTRAFLVALRDEIDRIEQEIPVVEVTT